MKASIKVLKRLLKKSKIIGLVENGSVAHLGERLVRNEEVAGSIPVRSTNLKVKIAGQIHPPQMDKNF